MKHLFKKIKIDKTIYLGILFVFILISCNAPENLIDEANYNNSIKIDNVEIKELFKRKEFNDIVTKLYKPKNGNEVSRTVMENQYGFTILDQPAKVIEQNNKITYTLAISRDNQLTPSTSFENLIISNDSLNQPQAVIVKYRPFVPMNQLLTNNGGFEGEVKVTPITYNNTQATGKISYSCFNILLSKCTGIPYDCGGSFCGYYHYTICVADDETGGGGDNGTVVGSGSTAGSGNPNGGGSNPITTPNGGSTNTVILANPCETLNQAIQNPIVNQAIQVLKTKTTTDKETAFAITRKYHAPTESYTFNTEQKQGDSNNTVVPVGGTIKGQGHNHPKHGQSIPSIGDVKWLSECQENITPTSASGYNIVVVPNPASPNDTSTAIVYAITVDNLETLTNSINDTFNRPDLVGLTIDQKYKKLNDEFALKYENVQNSSSGMEQKFLELYANFGISLHKYDNNTNNWNNLKLVNNTVTPQPCE